MMEPSDANVAESSPRSPRTDSAGVVCAVCGTACAKPVTVYRHHSHIGETLCLKCDLTFDKLEHEEAYERYEVQEDDGEI